MDYTDEYGFCRHYLTVGETILWKGKPQKAHLITKQDATMIPFSLFVCGFSLFWEYSVLSTDAPFFFKLAGIPLVLTGLYMLVGRFFHNAYLRKRTYYVITNKRIIRRQGNKINLHNISDLPAATVTFYDDGSGTIEFGMNYIRHRSGTRTSYTPNPDFLSLECITDVAKVQQLIAGIEV